MCGCSQTRTPKTPVPSSMLSSSGNFSRQSIEAVVDGENKTQMVMVEYVGPLAETFSLRSRVSREVSYRFGNNEQHRTKAVFLGDAEWMIGVVDRNAQPTYIILSSVGVGESNNPAVFAGIPITA